jgi:hypothetical protein
MKIVNLLVSILIFLCLTIAGILLAADWESKGLKVNPNMYKWFMGMALILAIMFFS